MIAADALVRLEGYLATVYEPDCEYVDGELIERNVGEADHSALPPRGIAYRTSP